MRDVVIDDGDFKEAPNFWAFTHDKRWLGANFFSRQLYPMSRVFGEICPKCSNPKYYKHILDVPLDMKAADFPEHFQLLEYGVCPKCKSTKLDLLNQGLIFPYQEMAGLAGQRVGKSMITAGGANYLTHKMLKLQRPAEAYGGLLNPLLVGTFVGLTYDAAAEQLWMPYRTFMENSPWFRGYHEMLERHVERTGNQGLFKMNQFSLYYGHRQILVYPSGPNRKTLRGKTRFFGAVDELDFFGNEDEAGVSVKMNGVEVYKSLNNSLLTLRVAWKDGMRQGRVNLPNAYQFNISSPSSVRGVLTESVNRNLYSKKVYAFHAATWEINPKIKKSDLAQEYADDPAKADRDFGAIPPMTDTPFIAHPQTVLDCIGTRPNAVQYHHVHKRMEQGGVRRAAVIDKILAFATKGGVPPSTLSIDAGYSNNSFALSAGYRVDGAQGRPVIHIPAIVEVMPEKNVASLDYAAIYEFVMKPIIKELNIKAVFADRWNSLKLLHDIAADFGILAEIYSIKYHDFFLVRSYMEAGNLILPKSETPKEKLMKTLHFDTKEYPKLYMNRPIDHLFMQGCTVRDSGRDVIKGTKLTDDSWRATALTAAKLLDDDFVRKYMVGDKVQRHRALGVSSSGLAMNPNASRMGATGMAPGGQFSVADLYRLANGGR